MAGLSPFRCLPIGRRELLLFIILLFVAASFAYPVNEIFEVAKRIRPRDRGDPNLECRPTLWSDFIAFYLGNYLAHAATVVSVPGERTADLAMAVLASLLYPSFGALRGVTAMVNCAIKEKSSLRKAARAGALCMVVRTQEWRPEPGDQVSYALFRPPSNVDGTPREDSFHQSVDDAQVLMRVEANGHPTQAGFAVYSPPWCASTLHGQSFEFSATTREICGSCTWPPGHSYTLAIVPGNLDVCPIHDGTEIQLPCNYSIVKILVALGQTLYAISTLYRTRGDQISQYGYAAFGLTVAPYAVMSLVNLLGSGFTPDYPTVYLVRTPVMNEAEKRGGSFYGVVGVLEEISETDHVFRRAKTAECSHVGNPLSFSSGSDGSLVVHFQQRQTPPRPSSHSTRENGNAFHLDNVQPESYSFLLEKRSLFRRETWDGPAILIPACGLFKKFGCQDDASMVRSVTIHPLKGSYAHWNLLTSTVADGSTRSIVALYVAYCVSCLPILINGVISGFRPGQSSKAQRAWTMAWLVLGIPSGNFLGWIWAQGLGVKWIGVLLVYSAPAIGGYVVVGLMLKDFGTCVRAA